MKLNDDQMQQVGNQTGLRADPATTTLPRHGCRSASASTPSTSTPTGSTSGSRSTTSKTPTSQWRRSCSPLGRATDKQALKPTTPTRSEVVVELAPVASYMVD